jgi:hypothetical protein
MATGSCANEDTFLTHGRNVTPEPADKIVALRNNVLIYHPDRRIALPSAAACDLVAGANVQGRVLNGVAPGSVCNTAAASYSGIFIHDEQDPGFRAAAGWLPPVNDAWPLAPSEPPPPPTGLTGSAGKKRITLNCAAAPGALSHKVRRSSTNGRPYTVIASGVTGTSYTNTGLRSGATQLLRRLSGQHRRRERESEPGFSYGPLTSHPAQFVIFAPFPLDSPRHARIIRVDARHCRGERGAGCAYHAGAVPWPPQG